VAPEVAFVDGGGEFLSAASSYLLEMKASGAVGDGVRRALWPVGDGCERSMRASYETEEYVS
jgi:hypothetical protein